MEKLRNQIVTFRAYANGKLMKVREKLTTVYQNEHGDHFAEISPGLKVRLLSTCGVFAHDSFLDGAPVPSPAHTAAFNPGHAQGPGIEPRRTSGPPMAPLMTHARTRMPPRPTYAPRVWNEARLETQRAYTPPAPRPEDDF